jgi:hypothetical protein
VKKIINLANAEDLTLLFLVSLQPKSVTPFQRVKLEAVKFADERLQDNSYWAKVLHCFTDHIFFDMLINLMFLD